MTLGAIKTLSSSEESIMAVCCCVRRGLPAIDIMRVSLYRAPYGNSSVGGRKGEKKPLYRAGGVEK